MLTLADPKLSYNMFQAIAAALFSVFGYGMLFWILFIVSLVIFDLILIVPKRKNLKTKLMTEWLIISCPFIYWAVKYHEWVIITAIIAFL